MKMSFNRLDSVFVHDGTEYDTFDDAVMAALDITKEIFRVYTCPNCWHEERGPVFFFGDPPDCHFCKCVED